jgi:5-formyltetrahydrofolate cyclo-ligase
MQHILLQENTCITVSKFGIPEPQQGIEVLAHSIDVVFVPLLAFDKKGHRIGYGKGFYDRFLKQCAPEAQFVGLSFFAPENKIPSASHDIALDYCVTPTNIYTF